MFARLKQKIFEALKWSEAHTHLDMPYLARGGFWVTLEHAASAVVGLFLALAFANLLPRETYGTYRYLLSLVGSWSALTLTGMATAVMQAAARGEDGAFRYAVRIQSRWNAAAFLVVGAASAYYFAKGNALFGGALLILGIAAALTDPLGAHTPFLLGKKDFRRSSIFRITSSFFYTAALLAALFVTKNLLVIVAAYAMGQVLPALFFYARTVRLYRPGVAPPEAQKELWRYGRHLSIINILAVVASYADKIVLFQFLGPAQLAVYSFAHAMPERVRGLMKNSMSILLPKLSAKSIADIRPVFYKRIFQGMAIGVPISAAYIFASPVVFRLLLPKYLDSIRYSQVYALVFVLALPLAYLTAVFRAQKFVRPMYVSSVVVNTIRITVFIVAGMLWGIWGIIGGDLAVYSFGLLFNTYLWEREQKRPQEVPAAPGAGKAASG